MPAADQQIGVIDHHPIMSVQGLPERRLGRHEVDARTTIVPHDPAYPALAQNADTIEHEQCLAVIELRNARITAIAEGVLADARHGWDRSRPRYQDP